MSDQQHDEYSVYAKDINPRPGLTPLDEFKLQGGKSILRAYEQVRDVEERLFPRDPLTILAQGAALGQDEHGTVTLYRPNRNQKFLGFLRANSENQVAVMVRGSVVLRIPGVSENHVGRCIYVHGPNKFSLTEGQGSALIGQIRYIQGNRCAVAFKREGDQRPLNLTVY